MSSHHFVREGQEPALFVFDPQFDEGILFQLLEWNPKLIACEPALNRVLTLGIKVDVVVSRGAAEKEIRRLLKHQLPVDYVILQDYQDVLEGGLHWMEQQEYRGVQVFGSFELVKKIKWQPALDAVVWSEGIKWSYHRSGVFKKWTIRGSEFILTEECRPVISCETLGSFSGSYRLYRTVSDGMVTISDNKSFWLGEVIG